MPLNVSARPNPFPPDQGFRITVIGGTPPITYTPKASPPNPAGVEVTPNGATADVEVPSDTPPGTIVQVDVADSSTPPQTGTATSMTSAGP